VVQRVSLVRWVADCVVLVGRLVKQQGRFQSALR
jgi:hypothetical protein